MSGELTLQKFYPKLNGWLSVSLYTPVDGMPSLPVSYWRTNFKLRYERGWRRIERRQLLRNDFLICKKQVLVWAQAVFTFYFCVYDFFAACPPLLRIISVNGYVDYHLLVLLTRPKSCIIFKSRSKT